MMGVLGGGGGTPDSSWEPAWAHGSPVSRINSDTTTNTNSNDQYLGYLPIYQQIQIQMTSSISDTFRYNNKYRVFF